MTIVDAAPDPATLIAHLASEGPLLAAAAGSAEWDAPVPGTDWNLRALVTHVGGVHRWATAVVSCAPQDRIEAAGARVGVGPSGDDLIGWFLEAHTSLVEALTAAPDDLQCFTFLPAASPLHFWARRQAHETTIHRIDAEGAAGATVTPVAAEIAQDGIAELLGGFARRRSNAIATPGLLGLDATDGSSWRISFGGERIESTRADDLSDVDLVVRGDSFELYRWMWNRPNAAVLDGAPALATAWRNAVRVTW